MDFEVLYRASESRDPRFDGRFFVAVETTGIYCRSICPAPMPKREHVRFFPHAAAASAAGFRPCRRCRPETAPGSPAWIGGSAVVVQALRLIEAGFLDSHPVEDLAREVHVGGRQLRRLFRKHLGASPLDVAITRRLGLARLLVDQTDLPFSRIALDVGFGSVRQFNAAVKRTFGDSPSGLRLARRGAIGEVVDLELAYRPPLDWDGVADFLFHWGTPGVEEISPLAYSRTVVLDGRPTWIEVRPAVGRPELIVCVPPCAPAALAEIVARVRHLFDLEADPLHIERMLGVHPLLAPVFGNNPGLRVPGCWDGFEIAVGAVLAQQVSTATARRLSARLVREYGEELPAARGALTHVFPTAERLVAAEPSWLPPRRAEAIRSLARAAADGQLVLRRGADPASVTAQLLELPGIGPWTSQFVALRALGDPDAFPSGDLVLRKAAATAGGSLPIADLERLAEAWRPWRAYAAIALWRLLAADERKAA